MDTDQIRWAFEGLRSNIKTADEQTRHVLSCIANRLQLSGAGKWNGEEADALTALKRELRNWDITRRRWISPKGNL